MRKPFFFWQFVFQQLKVFQSDLSYTIGHGNNLISNLKATQPLAVNELQFIYIYIYIYNYIYTLHHHQQKEKTRRFPVTKIYDGGWG